MPKRSKKLCSKIGCSNLIDGNERYCENHRELQYKYDDKRGSAAKRGYDARWRKARKRYLARYPICVECKKIGMLGVATVVDHILPHKGDPILFWDQTNWQSLCEHHHNKKTANEDGGFGRNIKDN